MRSRLLSSIPGIRHQFGTRRDAPPEGVITVNQVHGTEILYVSASSPCWGEGQSGYDVLITDRPGIPIAVKTADCLPILMAEPKRGIVAAVHAGWKGTLARVVEKTIDRILSEGGKIENITAALGPNMGADCYEIETDVARSFESEFPGWPLLKKKSEAKWLLDVAEANRHQLLERGVRPARIDRTELCTHCRPDLFHSFRRDHEAAGRMVNFIELLG